MASWIDPPIWAHDLVMENAMFTGFHLESGWCIGQGALSNEESTTSDRNGTILEIVKVVS